MLAKIAAYTEEHRPATRLNEVKAMFGNKQTTTVPEAVALVVENALGTVPCAGVVVPTRMGTTARMISRFKPPVWIFAVSPEANACQNLAFSYGVQPLFVKEDPKDWTDFSRECLANHQVSGKVAMLAAGPSSRNPDANHRLEFLRLDRNKSESRKP